MNETSMITRFYNSCKKVHDDQHINSSNKTVVKTGSANKYAKTGQTISLSVSQPSKVVDMKQPANSKSKNPKSKPPSSDNVVKERAPAKKKDKVWGQTMGVQNQSSLSTQNSNEKVNPKSVKISDSKIKISHKKISSRNLKRLKLENQDKASAERIVSLDLGNVPSRAKHNAQESNLKNLEDITQETQNVNAGKQVSFATETSMISSKKRSQKQESKKFEKMMDGLSSTSLQIIKNVVEMNRKENTPMTEQIQK